MSSAEAHHHTHPAFDPDETLSLDETHEDHGHHATPFWTMFFVFMVLLFLTFVTVFQSRIPTTIMPETMHIIAALGIATVKAILVFAFFMHLKYDKPMNTVVVAATMFGVILFLALTLLDLHSRKEVDRIEGGELYRGGNMKLYAGSPKSRGADDRRPIITKPDSNIVDAARTNAAHAHGNEAHAPAAAGEGGAHPAEPAPAHSAEPAGHAEPAHETPKPPSH